MTQPLPFAKLHACGNDFLVVAHDPARTPEELRALSMALCERHTGAGADGVEFLTQNDSRSGAIRLYNADGSVAEISGNGTRCVAAYLAHEHDLRPGQEIALTTDAGLRTCRLVERCEDHTWLFASNMGVPAVGRRAVELATLGLRVEGVVVRTGNPHYVIFCQDEQFQVEGQPWHRVGELICFHPDFAPEQTNVEFVHTRGPRELAIRIFERGVGPTTSSGTGTSASAAAAMALALCERNVTVHAPGGAQHVEWPSAESELVLTGPATLVYEGAFLAGTAGRPCP